MAQYKDRGRLYLQPVAPVEGTRERLHEVPSEIDHHPLHGSISNSLDNEVKHGQPADAEGNHVANAWRI